MTEQLLKTKNLQKLEMLKALGHCNEVVGRMLYNAEQYFNIVQKVESSQKYKGHKTEIDQNIIENEIQIKLRLVDQMQNSINIIKLFNMNSKNFKKKFNQMNEEDLDVIIQDIDYWIDNLVLPDDKNLFIIIKKIVLGEFTGSLQEIRNRLRDMNLSTNKNFRERRAEDIVTFAPYTMESVNDTENNIERKYEENVNDLPHIRRGESSSSNPINNYQKDIKIMKLINDYRSKAMNDICKYHSIKPIKRGDCSTCLKEIDLKSEAMYYSY